MKILHIFGKMDRGGAETRTIEIMKNIDREKYHFDFLACSGQIGDYDDDIEQLGGQVYKEYIYSLNFYWKLYKIIKNNQYNIVHSHIHYASGVILFIAWLAGCKKRISHFRITGIKKDNRTIKNRIFKLLVALFSTDIIAVNYYTMECVWGKNWRQNEKCKVLLNGIESKFIPYFQSDTIKQQFGIKHEQVFINVGRIEKQKNHVFLLQLFNEYIKEYPETKLLIIGRDETNEAKELSVMINNLGLQEKVILTGLRSDISNFYNMADMMIFPSLFEGIPGAVLEALSAGLPVISSDIGAHREIKQNIQNLRIVKLNNNLTEWVNEIKNAIDNDHKEEIRKQFNRSPYAVNRHIEELILLYEN